MAQSVELLLDPVADGVLRQEWEALAAAGLPSERRSTPSAHHRPHITLFAGDAIDGETDAVLPSAVAGLELHLRVGSPLVFGPRGRHRGSYVLVRQVVPSLELLDLQRRVASVCAADETGQFGPGRWSPHVTLARRLAAEQVGRALPVLGREGGTDLEVHVTVCRRWDGTAKKAWSLT
ncbi:MAG: 2'-5' RNA ligase family protein [Actinomycetes bacterium]